jgi:hypothetical protein
MRILILVVVSFLEFFLISCREQPKNVQESVSEDSVILLKAESFEVDNKKKKVVVDSFLSKPFDLQKFKKRKGQSHSGDADRKTYYFKPEFKGFYYGYFMFPPIFEGYIGNSMKDTVYIENAFRIVTYKPIHKNQFDYIDNGEELIEVTAKYNDFDLPELAFIGLDTIEIKNRLGEKLFLKKNHLVYAYQDKVLILRLEKDKVDGLKYVRLNMQAIDFKQWPVLFEY